MISFRKEPRSTILASEGAAASSAMQPSSPAWVFHTYEAGIPRAVTTDNYEERMSARKNPETNRGGGPGAAHQNRKHPEKSKPHGELPQEDAGTGNAATRVQHKSMEKVAGTRTDAFAGHTGTGGSHRPSHQSAEGRGYSNAGHTAKDDDLIKPKNRRQVR
jgi:hypothetical protein